MIRGQFVFVLLAIVGVVSAFDNEVEGVWSGTTASGCPFTLQMRDASFLGMERQRDSDDTECQNAFFTGGFSRAGEYAIVIGFANSVENSFQAGTVVEAQLGFSDAGNSLVMVGYLEGEQVFRLDLTKSSANSNDNFEGAWMVEESGGTPGVFEFDKGTFTYFTYLEDPPLGYLGTFEVTGDQVSVYMSASPDVFTLTTLSFTYAETATGFTLTENNGQTDTIEFTGRPAAFVPDINGVWARDDTSSGCREIVEIHDSLNFRALGYNCAAFGGYMNVGFSLAQAAGEMNVYYAFSTDPLPSSPLVSNYSVDTSVDPNTMHVENSLFDYTWSKMETPESVIGRFTLDGDYSAFDRAAFINAIATAASTSPRRFAVLNVEEGSIIVTLAIESDGGSTASDLYSTLATSDSLGGYTVTAAEDTTPTSPASSATGLLPSSFVVALAAIIMCGLFFF